jgi:hypothetical protein
MSEAAVAESVTIATMLERVALARAFVPEVLGDSHPCHDLAMLLASELVANSVRHRGLAHGSAPGLDRITSTHL